MPDPISFVTPNMGTRTSDVTAWPEIFSAAAAQTSAPPPAPLPQISPAMRGPFSELDLLAIGVVLVAVMLILGVRALLGRRR